MRLKTWFFLQVGRRRQYGSRVDKNKAFHERKFDDLVELSTDLTETSWEPSTEPPVEISDDEGDFD